MLTIFFGDMDGVIDSTSVYFAGERPELVVVEDGNSGYEFFSALCEKSGIACESAGRQERNL